MTLVLSQLREKNEERQKAWCGDNMPDLMFRMVELAGEVGEAANIVKKIEREKQGWRGSRSSVGALAEEIGDIVVCADLVALAAGFDLDRAVVQKFNETSIKQGFPILLNSEPLAWAIKDHAGGWTITQNQYVAKMCQDNGQLVRPLYLG